MVKLSEIKTTAPDHFEKSKYKKERIELAKKIGVLSRVLQAEQKHNLLVVLQGMDSSGKDGVARKVFSEVSPSVVDAYSFKKPTDLEFAHDFLWRVHAVAPAQGTIQIYIRSHYEDVLIQRVHKWIDERQVDARFASINAYERLLVEDNNTTVLKFFLHLSKDKQKEKLIERIEDPERNWKHNDGDWEERKYWDNYMHVYEDALNRSEIPWTIVPADQRWYRDYVVAQKVCEVLESFDMKYPVLKHKPNFDYHAR